ncbi:hypothetical protein, partial [Chimaeribacter arupi]|uniref:hypothetical protein n=1 Tax=Chimaeribacter arupi TaxID=2060066 RepID=UPI0019D42C98
PAASLGNDFYAPTTSANQKVCEEIVGGVFFRRVVRAFRSAFSCGNALTLKPVIRKNLSTLSLHSEEFAVRWGH